MYHERADVISGSRCGTAASMFSECISHVQCMFMRRGCELAVRVRFVCGEPSLTVPGCASHVGTRVDRCNQATAVASTLIVKS